MVGCSRPAAFATVLLAVQWRMSRQSHQTLEWQYIWRWMKHDQYKARLSIIHAGVTLWHIARAIKMNKARFAELLCTRTGLMGCVRVTGSVRPAVHLALDET
jgi:hypothetical protein